MLGSLDSLMEAFGCVGVQNWDGLLSDDCAGVYAGIDEMNGAAADLDSVIEGLFPRFQARK